MTFTRFYVLSMILAMTVSIQIPLTQSQFRCMLVYSAGNDETVKIDINFPHIPNWTDQDQYYLTLRNTKSGKLQSQYVSYGHFRREIHIYEKVIYEVCFEFLSPRQVTQEILVEYDADTHYIFDKDNIKLPQNLMKADHMRQTYKNALVLKHLAQNMLQLQRQRAEMEQKQFQQAEQAENKIILVTMMEIALILGIAGYQFQQMNKKMEQFQISPFEN